MGYYTTSRAGRSRISDLPNISRMLLPTKLRLDGVWEFTKEPVVSLKLPVTVRAEDDALLSLFAKFGKAYHVSVSADTEALCLRINMVEIQRLNAGVIPTAFAASAVFSH